MQVLSSRVDIAAFFGLLEAASRRVLMLDYDGTIAPFSVRPEQAIPYPGVAGLLRAIMDQGDTRVVIISGRRAAEIAAVLPLEKPPEIWGAHGWEHMTPDGSFHAAEPAAEARLALADADARAAGFQRPGGRIERKPASIALHWRGLPARAIEQLANLSETAWRPLSESGALEWLPFDGGVELRARGANKQHAVKAVLSETPPDAATAYLGDDQTDEDAFRAVKTQGLAVLVRPEYRATAADLWIRPPRELLEFIGRWRRGSTAG